MPVSVEQIVVHASSHDKRAITEKARRLGLSISELMTRATVAYEPIDEAAWGELAAAAQDAAERAIRVIDDRLEAIDASNRRIDAMEAHARRARLGEKSGSR